MTETGSLNVRNFGARGDGTGSDTAALQKAIDTATSQSACGTVVVPPGVYLCGTLFLRSNLTLDLRPGAVLLASPDPGEYPALPLRPEFAPHLRRGADCHRHFLFADRASHLTVRGGGAIDGNVSAFTPDWETRAPFTWTGASKRPFVPTIEILRCSDVRLQDIEIRNSPGWTCHLCLCDRVWVTGVRMCTYVYAGNSDGFDVDGCRDVFFSDCHIETGDDCIVLKSFPETRSCERIAISNCILKTMCAAVKIGTESWHDFRQISFTNSVVTQSSRAFQITCFDGGTVEDIVVANIVADTNTGNPFNRAIHVDLARRHTSFLPGVTAETAPPVGRVRRVTISNFIAKTDGRLIFTASPGAMLQEVVLRDIALSMPWIEDPADTAGKYDSLQCSASCPNAEREPAAVVVENAEGFRIDGLSIAWPDGPPGEDFLPKHARGHLLRDPRREPEPMPACHVFSGRNVRGSLALGAARPFRLPDARAVLLDERCAIGGE